MSQVVFLDSGPLGLLTQRRGVRDADACRDWLARHLLRGVRFAVAEIVDYELRRELLRAGKSAAVSRLDAFNAATPGRYVPLTTKALRLAAQLWANLRQRGLPTTDRRDLDIDVILAAQALSAEVPPTDLVIATTNVAHLSRMANASLWTTI